MSLALLLFLIFLILKLCGVIAWAWIWVFAPLWIPAALALVFALFGFSFVGLAGRRMKRQQAAFRRDPFGSRR